MVGLYELSKQIRASDGFPPELLSINNAITKPSLGFMVRMI